MATSVKSLSTLLAQTTLDDHDEFLKAANAAIKKSKADLEAYHVKAVALVKLERYDDAVKVFEEVPQLQEKARFEYAYALYRSGNAGKAVGVVQGYEIGRGLSHVLAQAAYRSENFEQAADVYKQLLQARVEDEEYDIRINAGAVDAQLEWSGDGHLAVRKKPQREDLEAFETAYNAACGSISRGEYVQGEVCLKRAKDLCNESDLSEEEKLIEILPMTVQQVYLLTQLGRVDEAEQLATTIPFAGIKELSTRYIAQVNSIAATKEHSNPYLSNRLFHSSPKPSHTDHLFSFQTNLIRQDQYVIDLLSNKVAGVAESTAKVIAASPVPTTSAAINTSAVLNAAAHARSSTEKAALKEILPLLEKRPNDVGLLLTITNLYVLTNNHAAATSLLESFFKRLEQSGTVSELDVRHAPGLVATLVSLYAHQGRHGHSKTELAKAARYWRHKSKTPPKPLMTAAGTALLESQNEESIKSAGEIFQSLYEKDQNDKAAIAGVVAAYSIVDPSKLHSELIDFLPQASHLVAVIDAAALEDAGVPVLTAGGIVAEQKKRPANKAPPAKAHKIRKSRMPQDFVEGKKMDAERWLPMRDRSYYRPKGKKGKKRMEGLTQGGPVAEEKAENKQAPAAGKQQPKKKKGKGGKW